MNVLIVYAHPEPTSLNGSLKDFAVRHLAAAGHQVQVSDGKRYSTPATTRLNRPANLLNRILIPNGPMNGKRKARISAPSRKNYAGRMR